MRKNIRGDGELPFPLLEGEMQFSLLSYTDYGESGRTFPIGSA